MGDGENETLAAYGRQNSQGARMRTLGTNISRESELLGIIRQLEADKQYLVAIIKAHGLSIEQQRCFTARPTSLLPAPIPAAEPALADLAALQWTN